MSATGKKMFNDRILALQYGPVIKEILNYYHKYNDQIIPFPNTKGSAIIGRMTSAMDGLDIIRSCQDTLHKYGDLSTSELVKLTHRKGSPWEMTVLKSGIGVQSIISDEIILKYHSIEEL